LIFKAVALVAGEVVYCYINFGLLELFVSELNVRTGLSDTRTDRQMECNP